MPRSAPAPTAHARPSERLVWVCDQCFCASCWHGEFMCERARGAGIVRKPVSELRKLRREHPDHFSRKKLREVYGQ